MQSRSGVYRSTRPFAENVENITNEKRLPELFTTAHSPTRHAEIPLESMKAEFWIQVPELESLWMRPDLLPKRNKCFQSSWTS